MYYKRNYERTLFMIKATFLSHIYDISLRENISVVSAMNLARNLGYIGLDANWTDINENSSDLKKQLNNSDLHLSSVYRFCDLSDAYNQDEMKSFLDVVAQLECTKVMLIPGFFTEQTDRDTQINKIIEALNNACELATKYNITPTIEKYDYILSPCGENKYLSRILDSVPALGFTFDTGNYIYFDEDVLEGFDKYKDRIRHVHIKDRSFSPYFDGEKPVSETISGKLLYPAPSGHGIIPIKNCIDRLKSIDYNGYLCTKFFGAERMLDYLKLSSSITDGI